MTHSVAVVIPSRNREERLPALIDALARQLGVADFTVIVVNDASDDATVETLATLRRKHAWLHSIDLTERRGPAAARNAGWTATAATLVAFTDDDCLPRPEWLARLCEAAQASDVVQGRTVLADDECVPGPFASKVEVPAFSWYFETCNIAYRREVLEQLGGFDEMFGYTLGGAPNGEDIDLGWRAVEHGWRVSFASAAVVEHPLGQTSFGARLRGRTRSVTMPYVVSRHRRLREHFPHPYVFQASHVPAGLGLLALLTAPALPRRWSAVAVVAGFLPYIRHRLGPGRLGGRRRQLPITIPAMWVIDAADIVVLSIGSLRWRTLLL